METVVVGRSENGTVKFNRRGSQRGVGDNPGPVVGDFAGIFAPPVTNVRLGSSSASGCGSLIHIIPVIEE